VFGRFGNTKTRLYLPSHSSLRDEGKVCYSFVDPEYQKLKSGRPWDYFENRPNRDPLAVCKDKAANKSHIKIIKDENSEHDVILTYASKP
jgi:hypothetical protein